MGTVHYLHTTTAYLAQHVGNKAQPTLPHVKHNTVHSIAMRQVNELRAGDHVIVEGIDMLVLDHGYIDGGFYSTALTRLDTGLRFKIEWHGKRSVCVVRAVAHA